MNKITTLSFSIPGIPHGKGRPRFAKMGNFVKAYTPQSTEIHEAKAMMIFRDKFGSTLSDLLSDFSGPIVVAIAFKFPIPKSFSKAKQNQAKHMVVPVCKKPDLDNLAKAILDGLNGVAWYDDSQIFELRLGKIFSPVPETNVTIEYFKEEVK